jgi:hypothetical protein
MKRTPEFELLVEKAGHLKIRLFYHTREPKHLRSRVLETEYNASPPYVEDVSILLPCSHVYNRLSAFDSLFRALQLKGVLAMSDKLKDFEIRDEDLTTLAYCEVEE